MLHYAQVLWKHPGDEIPTRDMPFEEMMDRYIYPSSNYDNEPKNGETRLSYKCEHVNAIQSYLKLSKRFPAHAQFIVYAYMIDTRTQQPCGRAFMIGDGLSAILQRIRVENDTVIRCETPDTRYEVVGVWYEYPETSKETSGIDQVINKYCRNITTDTKLAGLYDMIPCKKNSFNLRWQKESCSVTRDGSVKLGYWVNHVIDTLMVCQTVADLSIFAEEPTYDFPDDAPKVRVSFVVFSENQHVTVVSHNQFCQYICDVSMMILVTVKIPGLLEMVQPEMMQQPYDDCPITIMAMSLSSSPKIIRNVVSEPTKDGFIYDIVATATTIQGEFTIVKETVAPSSFIIPS